MNLKKATLKKHTPLTYDVFQLDFETDDPAFTYKAGQFVTIRIPQPENSPLTMRSYSIASKPATGKFELCVKTMENGVGSNYLNNLQPDKKIEFLGPLGEFTFKSPPDKKILFIGTGTGLAPLKSILEDELETKNNQQSIHLLFGVRHIKDLFYQDQLAQLAAKHSNFTYTTTLSQPESEDWATQGGKIGRVTAHLENLDLDSTNTNVYICGLKDMVLQTTEILQQKGLPKEALYFERFN